MSDFVLENPRETLSSFAKLGVTSEPSVAGTSVGAGAAPPPPPTFSPNGSGPAPTAKQAKMSKVQRRQAYHNPGRIVAAVLICAALGLPVTLATSPSATAAKLVAASASGTGDSNARSAPAQGGSVRYGCQRAHFKFHNDDISRPEVHCRRGVLHEVREGDDLDRG